MMKEGFTEEDEEIEGLMRDHKSYMKDSLKKNKPYNNSALDAEKNGGFTK